jgi:hypothetical protein
MPSTLGSSLERADGHARAHAISTGGLGHTVGELLHAIHKGSEEGTRPLSRLRRVLPSHLLDLMADCDEGFQQGPIILFHLQETRESRSQ